MTEKNGKPGKAPRKARMHALWALLEPTGALAASVELRDQASLAHALAGSDVDGDVGLGTLAFALLVGPLVGVAVIVCFQVLPLFEDILGLPRDTIITFGVMIFTVLIPNLVRFRRSLDMQDQWYASRRAPDCPCTACGGQPIDRFGVDEYDDAEPTQTGCLDRQGKGAGTFYNVATGTAPRRECRDGDRSRGVRPRLSPVVRSGARRAPSANSAVPGIVVSRADVSVATS